MTRSVEQSDSNEATALLSDPLRADLESLEEALAKQAKELDEARSEAAKYRAIIEGAKEGVYVAQDGTAKFVNEVMVELSGYSAEELKERSFLEFVHPEDRQSMVERHLRRLRGESFPSIATFRCILKSGEIRLLRLHSQSIEWDGRAAVLNYISDVTPLQQLRDELRHAQRLDTLGHLTSGLAHDLGNMMTALGGYLVLAQRNLSRQEVLQESLERSSAIVDRANAFVGHVLHFARKRETRVEMVRLEPLVLGIIELLRASMPAGVKIELLFSSGITLLGDRVQLQQVFLNLITNSLHAMGGRTGTISLRAKFVDIDEPQSLSLVVGKMNAGRYILIELEDDGPGVDERLSSAIFEPFFTTKKEGEGTGMGLAMVRQVVLSHGGGISITRGERGAWFKLFLNAEHDTLWQPPLKGLLPSGTERILIADSGHRGELLLDLLPGLGYRVDYIPTVSLRPGIRLSDFDLLIVDEAVNAQVLQGLRQRAPTLRILGCSVASAHVRDLLDLSLSKPLDIQELALAIRQLLDNKNGEVA